MENNSFVIDSSVLVAFYDDRDIHHTDALIVMKEIQGRNVFVHSYVVQEVATILCYRFGSLLARRFLEDVVNSENVTIPWTDVKEEIEFFNNLNKKISFTDTSLILLSKKKGIPLLTFDRQAIALLRKIK